MAESLPIPYAGGKGGDDTQKDLISYLEGRVRELEGDLSKRDKKDKELGESRKHVRQLEKEVSGVRGKMVELVEELRVACGAMAEKDGLAFRLQTELDVIRNNLSKAEGQNVSFVTNKKEKSKLLKDRIDEITAENDRLRADKDRLKDEGRKAIDEHRSVVSRNYQTSEEAAILKEKLNTLRASYEGLANEHEALLPQLDDYEKLAGAYKEKWTMGIEKIKTLEYTILENEEEFKMVPLVP
jgi:uncharacterized coiled-coil DUF342 family protein